MENRVYPRLKNAILLCLLLIGIATGLSLLLLIFEYALDLSIDPLLREILPLLGIIVSYGLVLLIGHKKTKRKFSEVFKFNAVPPFLWVAATILTVGLMIILSLLDNLLTLILPMPGWWIAMFRSMAIAPPLIIAIISIGIQPAFTEELLFRGLILDGLSRNYSKRKAIIVSALLFGLIHFNPWQFLLGFIIGIFLAWICIETKSILLCIYIHFLNNTLVTMAYRYNDLIPIKGFLYLSSTVEFSPWWFTLLGALMLALGIMLMIKGIRKAKTEVQPDAIIEA